MEKKATVRDVAREAGVSVATVSYIMNGRTDQKISPETKKKVLQIANLLNYHPSHAAKSLVSGRNNIIGIAYQINNSTPIRNIYLSNFMELLVERMNRMHYDVLMLPFTDEKIELVNRNVDAVIAIDLEEKLFRDLADHLLVPVIGVDMLINDNLFYQIYDDFPKLFESNCTSKNYTLLMDAFLNQQFNTYITKSYNFENVLFYKDMTPENLKQISGHVIIMGEHLASIVYPFLSSKDISVFSSGSINHLLPKNINLINVDNEKKANYTINILLNALDRNFELDHDVRI